MEIQRPDQQDSPKIVLGGKALDAALSVDWTPRESVADQAIARVPNPVVDSKDIGTEDLSETTVNEQLVQSWANSEEEAPRVNGRPRRFDIKPNRRLSRRINKRRW